MIFLNCELVRRLLGSLDGGVAFVGELECGVHAQGYAIAPIGTGERPVMPQFEVKFLSRHGRPFRRSASTISALRLGGRSSRRPASIFAALISSSVMLFTRASEIMLMRLRSANTSEAIRRSGATGP